MKFFVALMLLSLSAFGEEESARDKLVRNAQRVEKGVTKDLGSLREKGCRALKGKECVPSTKEESAEKPNDPAN